jgi:hypothetical protein
MRNDLSTTQLTNTFVLAPPSIRAFIAVSLIQVIVVAGVRHTAVSAVALAMCCVIIVLVLRRVKVLWVILVVIYGLGLIVDVTRAEPWWLVVLTAANLGLLLWPASWQYFVRHAK